MTARVTSQGSPIGTKLVTEAFTPFFAPVKML